MRLDIIHSLRASMISLFYKCIFVVAFIGLDIHIKASSLSSSVARTVPTARPNANGTILFVSALSACHV
jgi:hypothetical protein